MRDPADPWIVQDVSVIDQLGLFIRVALPTWAKGILLRRRWGVALAALWDLDRKAVRFLQQLRRKYGEGPLLLRVPGSPQVLLLSAEHVPTILDGTPEPFTPASQAKRKALAHFEPHGSLITSGPERSPRRQFSDDVLESSRSCHHLGGIFVGGIREETAKLLASLRSCQPAELTWPKFNAAWDAAARRVVLGDGAGTDTVLTEELARLRARANWVFLPELRALRSRYYARLAKHVARAEPGSLAEMIARRPPGRDGEHPLDQVTQWLFAFDGGAMATFRALALFASHPIQRERAQSEIEAWRGGRIDLPYLRAGFLEAVRLWPTTPVILRETTEAKTWGRALPRGTGLIIYVPFFHRDEERLAAAHRFDPEAWLYQDPRNMLPFVPFSTGPGVCPGRHLVAMMSGVWLAGLLDRGKPALVNRGSLSPSRELPGTLDHFAIRLQIRT
jgi:hypothetical protein